MHLVCCCKDGAKAPNLHHAARMALQKALVPRCQEGVTQTPCTTLQGRRCSLPPKAALRWLAAAVRPVAVVHCCTYSGLLRNSVGNM